MTFDKALVFIRRGELLSRKEWTGGYVFLNKKIHSLTHRRTDGGNEYWLTSQSDLLAKDWFIVPNYASGFY